MESLEPLVKIQKEKFQGKERAFWFDETVMLELVNLVKAASLYQLKQEEAPDKMDHG